MTVPQEYPSSIYVVKTLSLFKKKEVSYVNTICNDQVLYLKGICMVMVRFCQ